MYPSLVVVLVLGLSVSSFAATVPLTLFTAQEVATTGARCLDGSPSGYYLYKTSNSAYKNNWVIFMEGGGWCFPNNTYPNVDDCYSRSKTNLGSSKDRPTSANVGFMRDYNFVYIFYCGGDFHSGQRSTPENGLYYAGHLTVKATINKLKTTDTLGSAQLVIVTGESAGGLGTLVNFDYVQGQFPSAVVKAWSNAGWFPETFVPYTQDRISLIAAFKILHAQVNPYLNQGCVSQHTTEPWLCYSGQHVYPNAKIPLFMSQSLFDNWAKGFFGVPPDFNAPATKAYWAPFGQAMRDSFKLPLAAGSSTGLFLTTNDVHVLGQGETVNGHTLNSILSNWIDGLALVKEQSNCAYVNCIPL